MLAELMLLASTFSLFFTITRMHGSALRYVRSDYLSLCNNVNKKKRLKILRNRSDLDVEEFRWSDYIGHVVQRWATVVEQSRYFRQHVTV